MNGKSAMICRLRRKIPNKSRAYGRKLRPRNPFFSSLLKAWRVQDEAGLAWWDALLAASALMAGCKLFISEDMQDGQLISGMRIVNPFGTDFLKRVPAQ